MPFLCIQNPLQCYSFWGFLMCLIVFLVGGKAKVLQCFSPHCWVLHIRLGRPEQFSALQKKWIQYRTLLDSWECIPVPARKMKYLKTFAIPDRTKVTLSWYTASFGPRNHEKWRCFCPKNRGWRLWVPMEYYCEYHTTFASGHGILRPSRQETR